MVFPSFCLWFASQHSFFPIDHIHPPLSVASVGSWLENLPGAICPDTAQTSSTINASRPPSADFSLLYLPVVESSPHVEGLCVLLPLACWAGWYKYAAPSLPNIYLWLLTLKAWHASICMTNKYWFKNMASHLHNTCYEILKDFFFMCGYLD